MENILDEKIYRIVLDKNGKLHENAIPDLVCVLHTILDKALKKNAISTNHPHLYNSLVVLEECLETTFNYLQEVGEECKALSTSQIRKVLKQFEKNPNKKEAIIMVSGKKIKVTPENLYVSKKELQEFKEKQEEKTND
jgi:hypothetical protein